MTDWKDGSYPDEHEEYDNGYRDGRKDLLKELYKRKLIKSDKNFDNKSTINNIGRKN